MKATMAYDYIPDGNTKRSLYSLHTDDGLMLCRLPFLLSTISNSVLTFFTDKRFVLVSHDVDPVPVLTHSPELFVFVNVSLPSIAICK